jgi:hypothetical protein
MLSDGEVYVACDAVDLYIPDAVQYEQQFSNKRVLFSVVTSFLLPP